MIILDVSQVSPSLTGIGRYQYELYNGIRGHIDKVAPFSKSNNMFCQEKPIVPVFASLSCSKKLSFLYSWEMKIRSSIWSESIFHGTSFSLPHLSNNVKKVVTIHDLAFMRYDFLEDDYFKQCLEKQVIFSVDVADKIIAVSNSTRKDLIELLGCDSGKINVVYLGVSKDASVEPVSFPLPKHFLLFVGAVNRRKNLSMLIRAMKKIPKDISLIVVGKKGNDYENVISFISKNNLQDRVIFAGYLSDSQIRFLYTKALAFVFPSLYEGFGLPVLEAMIMRCPTIVSRNSSLEELFSEVSYMFSTEEELIESICNVFESTEDELSNRVDIAYKYAMSFSWDKMVEGTVKVYKEIA